MSTLLVDHLPAAREGVFTIDGFVFESGERLDQLSVGYASYGQLNAARDNLLLLTPGTGNLRHSALGHVGPGRAYDTDRYFVVCTDAIGGGTSSQPADGLRGQFPRYTIRDMVRAQRALVRDGLGLGASPIAVLAGASMGAFQALEWLVQFPGSVRAAVLLVPGWRAGQIVNLTTARMFDMIALDAHWRGGDYVDAPRDGLRTAGKHYFPWTVSDTYLEATPGAQLEAEASATGDWFASWDAWNLMRRYQASAAHDVSQPFGGNLRQALESIDARVLLLPCAQDRLLGLQGVQQMANGIRGAQCRVIDSPNGHLAWRAVPGSPQTRFVTSAIREFLGLPASVATAPALAKPSGEG